MEKWERNDDKKNVVKLSIDLTLGEFLSHPSTTAAVYYDDFVDEIQEDTRLSLVLSIFVSYFPFLRNLQENTFSNV